MSDEHRTTGETAPVDESADDTTRQTGLVSSPDPDGTLAHEPDGPPEGGEPDQAAQQLESQDEQAQEEQEQQSAPGTETGGEPNRKPSVAGVLIGVLLALLGFTLVVQLRSNAVDPGYAALRQSDLLQIMSDLDAAERRLRQDVAALEQTKRELQSGAAGRDAAFEEAKKRADALGILAGNLKARGPGLTLRISELTGKIKAGTLLNAVQELRGAGAEALQIDGGGGSVRIIASTSFVDAEDGVLVDGRLLRAPYTIRAIGDPTNMVPAMLMRGGVKTDVDREGGTVTVDPHDAVEINETRSTPDLEYARPVR